MNLHEIAETLFQLLSHMLPSMFVGLYLADVLSKSGHLAKAGILMLPLSDRAHLPKGCSSVLTLCLLNKEAAFSMLSELSRKSNLSGKEVITVSMLATLPLSVRSIIFFVAPVSFSMLGLHVGLLFTSIYFCLELLKTLIGISAGRMMLSTSESVIKIIETERADSYSGWINLLRESIRDTFKPFKRVLIKVIPTLLIAVLLLNTGILVYLLEVTTPFTQIVGLPSSSCFIIISGLPSMIAGIASAEPLIMSGAITPMEAIRTLVIASMLHTLYNVIRMSLPVNISLFGPNLGGKVTCVAVMMEFVAIPLLLFLSTIS